MDLYNDHKLSEELERELVNLGLAIKLKDLGFKQDSVHYWCHHIEDYDIRDDGEAWLVSGDEYKEKVEAKCYDLWSAYSAEELAELVIKSKK